ncbi:hypothetical protein L596_005593 [Steinernema carpocapsae]|uniref:Uncharacterized protein n=1 Tax=Steinernema carpocapsae TaxID=34508 RepID=A0A4U8V0Y5_STECR|nr:hypothetical protein L596_005593 [Steinernema carpocapsae]
MVFIGNLPGYPDNIRLAKNGNLLIPFPILRKEEDWIVEEFPIIRYILAKIVWYIPQLNVISLFEESVGLIAEVNTTTGEVVEYFHDAVGENVALVTQVTEGAEGQWFMGNDAGDFISCLMKN